MLLLLLLFYNRRNNLINIPSSFFYDIWVQTKIFILFMRIFYFPSNFARESHIEEKKIKANTFKFQWCWITIQGIVYCVTRVEKYTLLTNKKKLLICINLLNKRISCVYKTSRKLIILKALSYFQLNLHLPITWFWIQSVTVFS